MDACRDLIPHNRGLNHPEPNGTCPGVHCSSEWASTNPWTSTAIFLLRIMYCVVSTHHLCVVSLSSLNMLVHHGHLLSASSTACLINPIPRSVSDRPNLEADGASAGGDIHIHLLPPGSTMPQMIRLFN